MSETTWRKHGVHVLPGFGPSRAWLSATDDELDDLVGPEWLIDRIIEMREFWLANHGNKEAE